MYGPQQPYGPPYAPPPPPPSKPFSKTVQYLLIGAGVLILFAVVAVVAISTLAGDDEPTAAKPSTSAPPASPASGDRVPAPTAAQQHTYLAALARIDPGLTVNTERVMRRAGRVCERILYPPGGNMTLEAYTVLELSGGNATIDEAQARQVIKAVRAWCR